MLKNLIKHMFSIPFTLKRQSFFIENLLNSVERINFSDDRLGCHEEVAAIKQYCILTHSSPLVQTQFIFFYRQDFKVRSQLYILQAINTI